jgi:hypothetical protein
MTRDLLVCRADIDALSNQHRAVRELGSVLPQYLVTRPWSLAIAGTGVIAVVLLVRHHAPTRSLSE